MDFAHALAMKAKELTRGMQQRAKRDPDVADYRAAFLPIIAEYLSRDAKSPAPGRGSSTLCGEKVAGQDCGKRAIFIKFGHPLCFDHKDRYAEEKTDQQFNR